MKNGKPMDLNSTHFISYRNIDVDEVDICEDAWGLNTEFHDVIELLGQLSVAPGRRLTKELMEKIRNHN